MEIINLFLFRYRNRRESFPDLYNFKQKDSNSAEEVSESFHWLVEFNDVSADRREYDIVKKRRNFAITRSKSFAQPMSSDRRPLRRSCFQEEKEKKGRKSLVFATPEVSVRRDCEEVDHRPRHS